MGGGRYGRWPTGRRRHRASVRLDQKARFRALVRHATDVILVLDAAGAIRYVSPAEESVLGYSPEERLGASAFALLHPDDTVEAHNLFARLLRTPGVMQVATMHVRHRDGSWRQVEATAQNLLDDPMVGGIVVNYRDVTERELAEQARRESDERLRTIVTNVPVVLFAVDHEGVVTLSAGKGLAAIGRRPGEADGHSLFTRYPDIPAIAANIRRALAGEAFTACTEVAGVTFENWYTPLRDAGGAITGATAVAIDITDRRGAEEARAASERRFRAVFDRSALGIALADTEGRILESNPALQRLLGYDEAALRGMRIGDFTHPDDLAPNLDLLGELLARRRDQYRMEKRYLHKAGHVVWGHLTVSAVPDALGRPQLLIAMVEDITERKRAEAALRQSEREYRHLFERANDAILVLDPEGEVVLDANARACALYGLSRERFLGLSLRAISPDPSRGDHYRETLLATGGIEGFETMQRRADGTPLSLYINASLIEYRGRPAILSINRDITGQKALEARLAHRASHDPLTDLPNRALFMDRLDQALRRATRRGEGVAVLFLDLNRFKVVNDSLGHEAGDRVLVTVAQRLLGCLRPGDTASRLGGDEFTVLLEGLGGVGDAIAATERIVEALVVPVPIGDAVVHITTSLGIAFSEAGEDMPADLVRRADAAMYQAKRRGPSRYEIFHAGLDAGMDARLGLEGELRRALEHGEFRVHYQPQIELATGQVVGFEALVRWAHPARGLVPPADFIPLAEETGLIVPLDRWVLEEACRQARHWHERFPRDPALLVSVNLSPLQFRQPTLVEDVARILRDTGVDPYVVQLELTESAIMEGTPPTLEALRQLKELGLRLAIDDFGTGYASLGNLTVFPLDTLKIDRSFVADLGGDPGAAAIVRATLAMAHQLGMRVVAEGVERADQLRLLREWGCDWGQGWHFAAALTREAATQLLRQASR